MESKYKKIDCIFDTVKYTPVIYARGCIMLILVDSNNM